jgi:hypothetical protein
MTEIVLKWKFSHIVNGYTQFSLVDTNDVIYSVEKMSLKNVYLWDIAKVGDKIAIKSGDKYTNIEKIG